MDEQKVQQTNDRKVSRKSVLKSAAQIGVAAAGASLVGPAAARAAARVEVTADASFNWRQFAGQTINALLVKHQYTDSTIPLLPQFEALTGITVKYEELTEEQYFEKLLLELASGGSPDVFMTGPLEDWQYAPAGWVAALDSYISDPTMTSPDWNFKDFVPSLISVNRWTKTPGQGVGQGSLWALPVNSEAYTLFYRKDILSQYKLAVPKTWTDLYTVATKLNGITFQGQKLNGFAARGDKTWPSILTAYGSIFNSYGGHDTDGHFHSTINSPQGIAATTLWAKLLRDGGPASVANFTWYEVQNAFAGGQVAMAFDADHMASIFEDPKQSKIVGKVGYAVSPAGPGGLRRGNMYVWSLGMNAHSSHKGAAWYFLQWAAGHSTLTASATKGNLNPTRVSVANDPGVLAYMSSWGNYASLYQQNMRQFAGLYLAPSTKYSEMGDRWALGVQQVILGQASATDALNSAAHDIDQIYSKAGLH